MQTAVPEPADVGHDGIPGHFCRQSGLQLKLNVHSKRADLVDVFSKYDLGELSRDQLDDSLRSLGIHLTNAYYITMMKPPLTLAKLLHALTIPDSDRYNLGLTSSGPAAIPACVSFDHTRQYAIFGDKWDSENSKLRANSSQVSRGVLRGLFKDLHLGLRTAADVSNSLTSYGIGVNARRQRLLINCERGSENGFRELVVEFQEPLLARDDPPEECHSAAARSATLEAVSRPASPTRISSRRRPLHRSEICTPNLTVWDHPDGQPTDWEKRNQELAELKQTHLQRTSRSHVVQNGCLVPRMMEPAPIPLQIRSVPEDPQLAGMRLGPDRPEYGIPPPDASPRIRPSPAFRSKAPAPRSELKSPWGNDADVMTGDSPTRPFSVKVRRYEVLSLKCCQEMADLDKLDNKA